MTKNNISFLIILIFLVNIIYSNDLIGVFSKYSKLGEFKIELNIKFEVDASPTSILMDIYVDNFKYFYFKINEPKILSGIDYYYNLHEDIFLTDLNKDVDSYNGIKDNLEIFRNFIRILSVTYSQDKFFIKEIKDKNYKIFYFYPKSKNALKFLGVDYTQMKIYLKEQMSVYFLEKIEFFNSNNKKRVDVKVNIIPYNTDFIKKNLLEIQK
ncbi:hypothetical protein SAMN02745164_01410 [Marinitoga hydrogenitolerans DSM 16785]|uniref:Outer membrane lipoprotein-sorting protein n=1 Tax=Marinitoga hydrogenitolerans (strain DSM 16785 / JCM 12826 / AT1271) TaxID=1122195 RepID=A0A1M4XEX7_MARH1|nr:hypothetical protein [Marinitoga hydrogenitolerans]SHE92008.1 hypothetical protein SAMN02745164_01410 [Marinitoga hydrogenitolerans DSM 16785]